uniref:Uncharacterized protein n=1 Tax=Trichuris muris TaxID=70415 RepID=A0A5S6QXF5_TRIMR
MIVEEVQWAPEFSTVNTLESSLMWMQVDDDGDSGCQCLPEPPAFDLGPPPLPIHLVEFEQTPGTLVSFDALRCPVKMPNDELNSYYATMHDGSFPSAPVSPIVFVLGAVTVTAVVAVSIMTLVFIIAKRTMKRNGLKASAALRPAGCFNCKDANGKISPASPTVHDSSSKSDLSYYSVRPILKGHLSHLDARMYGGRCFDRIVKTNCPDGASATYEEIPSGTYVACGENSTIESACFAPDDGVDSRLKNLEVSAPPFGSCCVGHFPSFMHGHNKLRCTRSTSPGLTLNTGYAFGEAVYPRSKYNPAAASDGQPRSTGFPKDVKVPCMAMVMNDGPWL